MYTVGEGSMYTVSEGLMYTVSEGLMYTVGEGVNVYNRCRNSLLSFQHT